VLAILGKNFSASPRENNRCLKTNQQLIVKWNFFYLATISQENLLHFHEPIKNSGTIPSNSITNEPHLIYSAEISASATIPLSVVLF
jgi:hypothetical protein